MAREKVKWCENCAMLEKMYLDAKAMHDTQVGDIRALREENVRLKAERRELCDERGLLRAAVRKLLSFEASCGEQDIPEEDRLFARFALKKSITPGVSPESPVCSDCGYRRENARLREYMRPDQIEESETVTKLIHERDEARAEVKELEHRLQSCPACGETGCECEVGILRREVARLEGLIVRCFGGHYEGEANAQLEAEARRIRGEK